ncbi:hypothetical protein ACFXPT_37315 [Streptomyces goshikiensis]|uniref:hypothetical protein n=1 Tax=Streptomyces goshikiensis TaxID=1942 RepID=UPI0036B52D64
MHTSRHTVLYDPDGLIEAKLPLHHRTYECLVKAVLAWTSEDILATRGYEEIGLQLTGRARAVTANVRRHANRLPKHNSTNDSIAWTPGQPRRGEGFGRSCCGGASIDEQGPDGGLLVAAEGHQCADSSSKGVSAVCGGR